MIIAKNNILFALSSLLKKKYFESNERCVYIYYIYIYTITFYTIATSHF